jgi:hypothetical protein
VDLSQIGMARRRRLGEDVRELERIMEENKHASRTTPHVNFIDGCEEEPKRHFLVR